MVLQDSISKFVYNLKMAAGQQTRFQSKSACSVVSRLILACKMADNDNNDVTLDVTGFYDRAKLLQSNRFHSDALKELDKVIELAGQCKAQSESLKHLLSCAWNDRGHLKYLQVNFDDAISDYTRAIELDKDFAVPYYNRGQIHYRMGM